MLKEALLAAALSLRPWHGDVEDPSARQARLAMIADAISDAAHLATCTPSAESTFELPKDCKRVWSRPTDELAYLLLSQAYFETHLALHVHEGRCRAQLGECDSGRAISLWQLQAGPHLSKEDWELLGGASLEATRRAAYQAAVSLGRGANYCRSLRGAIGLYATGQTCNWKPAVNREAFVRRLQTKFAAIQGKKPEP